ncbi:MAG: hypothetical protein US76_03490 [Parcubacteria group bacterium GW2011_GWA2_38_13b]|nr:MAG: hypothetical protein US76_03490 [Parcubacteria group bacterium GW2011_GWA2_38_13b]
MTELTEKEKALEINEVEKCDSSNLGSWNKSFKVKLRGDIYGIFKPKDGEMDYLRPAITGGTYYQRERAGYLVDKFLGFELIPITVIREIDGKIGSLQNIIPNAKTAMKHKKEELEKFHQKFISLFALDYIIYNSDRNWYNILIKEGKLYAIDNSLSFGHDNFRIDYINYISPEISEIYVIMKKMNRFLKSQEEREELHKLLQDLLKTGEIDACFARIEYLTDFISRNKRLPVIKENTLWHILSGRHSKKNRKIMPFWP